jgi:hypothetical protein
MQLNTRLPLTGAGQETYRRLQQHAFSEVLAANPGLQEFLHERTLNAYTERRLYDNDTANRRNARLNFVGGVIARNRNQYFLPQHQLLLALQSKHKLMNRQLWYDFSSVRTMPSYNWTDTFVTEALKQPRPLQYPIFMGSRRRASTTTPLR